MKLHEPSIQKISVRTCSIVFGVVAVLHGAGCGPTTYSQERIVFEPYPAGEAKQSRSNITVERQVVTELPAEFQAMAARCNALNGQPALDFQGKPMMERVSLAPSGTVVEKLSILNKTGHIIRLQGAVIAMFDPADNQYDSLDKDQIAAMLAQEHPCANAIGFKQSLAVVKLIDRNMEILPNRTVTGYVMFSPSQKSMPGIWRLSLYELPVKTDAAGNVAETVQFYFRTEAKRYVDTFRKQNPLAPPVRISSDLASN